MLGNYLHIFQSSIFNNSQEAILPLISWCMDYLKCKVDFRGYGNIYTKLQLSIMNKNKTFSSRIVIPQEHYIQTGGQSQLQSSLSLHFICIAYDILTNNGNTAVQFQMQFLLFAISSTHIFQIKIMLIQKDSCRGISHRCQPFRVEKRELESFFCLFFFSFFLQKRQII